LSTNNKNDDNDDDDDDEHPQSLQKAKSIVSSGDLVGTT
jgi:hypothetical protein